MIEGSLADGANAFEVKDAILDTAGTGLQRRERAVRDAGVRRGADKDRVIG